MKLDIPDVSETFDVYPNTGRIRVGVTINGRRQRVLEFLAGKLDKLANLMMAAVEAVRARGERAGYSWILTDGDIVGKFVDVRSCRLTPLPITDRLGLQAVLCDGTHANLAFAPAVALELARQIPGHLAELAAAARKQS